MEKDKKLKDEIIRDLDLEIAKLQGALEEARRQRTVEHDYYKREDRAWTWELCH